MHEIATAFPAIVEATAGLAAGSAATLVVHPLDLLKLRLQVNDARSKQASTSAGVLRSILKHEGGIRALYRGLGPNLIGNSASWALYFMWYDMSKRFMSALHEDTMRLSYYDFFTASSIAGMLTALSTNPLWVIKTRMLSTASKHAGAYSSTLDGFRRVYREEGVRGYYRGLTPSLFGVAHGALQFMMYEQMKQARSTSRTKEQASLNNYDVVILSATSKVLAGAVTYPYQVVRSRLQIYNADKHYTGLLDVVTKMWTKEGPYGFYKGLGPNLLRVVPSTCVMFLVYENTRLYLFQRT